MALAVAGSTSRLTRKLDLRLPLESYVLQAFISESLKPVIHTVFTFGAGHFYCSQSDKGELVFGGDLDGYNSYAQRGNLPVVEDVCEGGMALMPMLGRLRLQRMWAGVCDMTMDGSPIFSIGPIAGLYLNTGWNYGGFKATPASGYCFAHMIARDEPHPLTAAYASRPFPHRPFDRRKRSRRAAEFALMLIPCPYCGARDSSEFSYRGDATGTRPDPSDPQAEAKFHDYVYLRDNPRVSIGSGGITVRDADSG